MEKMKEFFRERTTSAIFELLIGIIIVIYNLYIIVSVKNFYLIPLFFIFFGAMLIFEGFKKSKKSIPDNIISENQYKRSIISTYSPLVFFIFCCVPFIILLDLKDPNGDWIAEIASIGGYFTLLIIQLIFTLRTFSVKDRKTLIRLWVFLYVISIFLLFIFFSFYLKT